MRVVVAGDDRLAEAVAFVVVAGEIERLEAGAAQRFVVVVRPQAVVEFGLGALAQLRQGGVVHAAEAVDPAPAPLAAGVGDGERLRLAVDFVGDADAGVDLAGPGPMVSAGQTREVDVAQQAVVVDL
ncbi:hypothetical protein CAI21_22350 [Alkalilimnicola ehrlichii]|nr:hypothetical protein CAI21_22350 [Alkalilimnicola ehrlichii]